MTHDPDQSMMGFADHLDELRHRMILSLVGVGLVCVVMLYFGEYVVAWLQEPLHHAQRRAGLPAKTFGFSVTTGFSIYLKVSLVSSFILAAPWIMYQVWKFVEAGLYATEKRVVYIMAPFCAMMVSLGVLFAYYIMLPICLAFLISFTLNYPHAGGQEPSFMDSLTVRPAAQQEEIVSPLKRNTTQPAATVSGPNSSIPSAGTTASGSAATVAPDSLRIPILKVDPEHPANGQIWFNKQASELKLRLDGKTRSVPLATDAMMSPLIEIGDYINFVTFLTLGVVVAFQLPLVMLMLGWSGLIEPATVSRYRKYCVFVCFFLGAFLTPSDPVSMLVLAFPLWGLFECGLLLMRWVYQPSESSESEEQSSEDEL